MLESYARHFLAWVNRWGDEGFEPIRKAWLQRAEGLSQRLEVTLPSAVLEGRFLDLDLEGNLVLQDDTGQKNNLPVSRVFNATN